MIAAFMIYNIAVATLLGAAAAACERALRLAHRPARFAWLTAMLLAFGITAARFTTSLSATATSASPAAIAPPADSAVSDALGTVDTSRLRTPLALAATSSPRTVVARLEAIRIAVAPGSPITRMDEPLLIGWLALTVIGFILIGLSALQLARPRPPWPLKIVDGFPVLLSHDLGPAVIGLFRYRIVLPAWVLDLAPGERDLVLAHEREHVAAGDSTLLFATTAFVALCPWNVALWWMARRLRFAIELDCDARVLRIRPDGSAYGALLLAVNERTHGGAMPIVALAEPVSLTERRIAAIITRRPRLAWLRAIAAALASVGLVGVSCAAPGPTRGQALITATVPQAPVASNIPLSSLSPRDSASTAPVAKAPSAPKDNRRDTVRQTPRSRGDTATPSALAPTSPISTSSVPRPDSLVPTGGRGLGRGNGPSIEQAVELMFRRLFDGITLTADQESRARELLTRLETDQRAQTAAAVQAITATAPRRAGLQAQRDSALRALLKDAARDLFDARVRNGGRSGGPPTLPPGGGGRGGGSPPTGGGRGGRGGADPQSIADLTFRRLFDGITLSPDDSATARSIIAQTQTELQALLPRAGALHVLAPANSSAVIMQAKSDSVLVSLLTNEADRATLHSRIVVAVPPPSTQP